MRLSKRKKEVDTALHRSIKPKSLECTSLSQRSLNPIVILTNYIYSWETLSVLSADSSISLISLLIFLPAKRVRQNVDQAVSLFHSLRLHALFSFQFYIKPTNSLAQYPNPINFGGNRNETFWCKNDVDPSAMVVEIAQGLAGWYICPIENSGCPVFLNQKCENFLV